VVVSPDLRDLAPRLGLVSSKGRWRDCPVCKGSATADRRFPLRLTDAHWWCNACGRDGSAFALVTWALLGREPREGDPELLQVYDFLGRDDRLPERPAPEPAPRRLAPVSDLAAFLRRCTPAHLDVEVADYLRGRGIDPARVPAGAVPRDLSAPFWPRAWSSIWRCVVPAFDVSGRLQNLHARAVVPTDAGKTRWAAGLEASGLVFASRPARAFLQGATPTRQELLVTEGLPDFLDAVAQQPDLPVISVESGSASALAAVRERLGGIRVFIGTHDDPQGNRYEQAVAAAIAPHPYRPLPLQLLRRRAA